MDLGDAGARARFVLRARDASVTQASGAVFRAAGIRVIRSAVQAPRMNPVTERWTGSCRRELLDRTLIWNQRHLMMVLREYEDSCNSRRPHRALDQAAPLRPLPDGVTGLNHFLLPGGRLGPGGRWRVYAPHGLSDVFNLVVRPNPVLVPREVYEAKSARWRQQWPS